MKLSVLVLALFFSTGCGSDSPSIVDTGGNNNGVSNNGTSGTNNGTSGTNNATANNIQTTGTNNATNNATSGTNNDTFVPLERCSGGEIEVDGICQRVTYLNVATTLARDVRSADPDTARWLVCSFDASATDATRVLRYDDGTCSVFFLEDGSSGSPQTILDAGRVTLESPTGGAIFEGEGTFSCYGRVEEPKDVEFLPNDSIDVVVEGGADFNALTAEFTAPQYMENVTFGAFDPEAPLDITWEPAGADSARFQMLTGPAIVSCTVPDNGSFSVPKAVMELVGTDAFLVTGTMRLEHVDIREINGTIIRFVGATAFTNYL